MYSICGVQQNSNHSLVRGFCWHLIKLSFENEDMEVQSLNREAVALGLAECRECTLAMSFLLPFRATN